MSPEQVAGKAVDTRTDVWAFGVVLLEMLTGTRLFTGETTSHVLAKVLEREPDFETLPSRTPPGIHTLLGRCLKKDRRRRLQSIGDARVEVEEALSASPATKSVGPTPVGMRSVALRWAVPWVAGLVTGSLIVALVSWNTRSTTTVLPLRKTTLPVPGTIIPQDSVAVSPNGQMVAYTFNRRLWIQDLARSEPVEIVDSDDARFPFWSADSESVAYVAGGSLKKVSAQGGRSLVLCATPGEFQGGTWGPQGTILFAQTEFGLSEVSELGGEPQAANTPNATRGGPFAFPNYLPNGSLIRFVEREDGTREVVVLSGGIEIPIVSEAAIYGLTYSPTGHILYGRGYPSDGVWAVPFSLDSVEVTGEPFLVAENGTLPSVSLDGTLVYAVFDDFQQLVWVSRSGEIEGTIGQPQGRIWEPALSADGLRVAVQGHEPGSIDIYIHDVERGTKTRLTFDPALDDEPTWAPDGDRIAFTSIRIDGSHDILIKAVDGTGDATPLVTGPSLDHAPNWSRDGQLLAYHSQAPDGGSRDLWYVDFSQQAEPVAFLQTPFEELVPQISPNSRYLAYQSNEQGRWDVFVVGFPNGEEKQQVSVNGGIAPRWSPQGDELFYLDGDTVTAVAVKMEDGLTLGDPQPLFAGRPKGLLLNPSERPDFPNYNVGNDGERFIAVQVVPSERGRKSRLVVVQNWFEEFRPAN